MPEAGEITRGAAHQAPSVAAPKRALRKETTATGIGPRRALQYARPNCSWASCCLLTLDCRCKQTAVAAVLRRRFRGWCDRTWAERSHRLLLPSVNLRRSSRSMIRAPQYSPVPTLAQNQCTIERQLPSTSMRPDQKAHADSNIRPTKKSSPPYYPHPEAAQHSFSAPPPILTRIFCLSIRLDEKPAVWTNF